MAPLNKDYTLSPCYARVALVIAISLASGIPFAPPSVSAQTDNSTTLEVYSGPVGDWKGMVVSSLDFEGIMMAACAMEVRMEGLDALDKTAWNGLKVRFCPFGERSETTAVIDTGVTVIITPETPTSTNMTIWDGTWGEWTGWTECPQGMFINGAEIRFDNSTDVDILHDNIAGNGLKVQCTKPEDQNDSITLSVEDGYFGPWTGMVSRNNQLVCGAEVQFQDSCGVLCDDTSLNGLRFKMCDIPSP